MKLDARVVNRFHGFMSKMDVVSPKNTLREWAAGNILGITDADVKAWARLRDPAAHGKLLLAGTDANDQKDLTALHRMRNLVNKMLLHAMRYEGQFYDYSDWNAKPFPCADPSML